MEVTWPDAKVLLELIQGTVNIDPRVIRVIALPDWNRCSPEPVARDGPVSNVLQPLAKASILGVLGDPVDLLVQLQHAIAQFGGLHEPGANSLINQWVLAAIAVRIGVLIGLLTKKSTHRLEICGDWLIGIENVHAFIGRDVREVLSTLINRDIGRDTSGITKVLVILTIGRRLVNNSGSFVVGDVFPHQNLPSIFNLVLF